MRVSNYSFARSIYKIGFASILFAVALANTAQASSTSISNGVCTYTDDNGVSSPCTPEQQQAALAQLQQTQNMANSLLGQIDPNIGQIQPPSSSVPSSVPSAAPSVPAISNFDLSSFLASYGI